MKNSSKHSRRRWKPHAIGAVSLALIAFLGAAAPEFLSDDFKQKFAPYNKWILAAIGIAVVVEIVRAIAAARANDDPPETSDQDPEAPQAGFSVGDHNQGAFSFPGSESRWGHQFAANVVPGGTTSSRASLIFEIIIHTGARPSDRPLSPVAPVSNRPTTQPRSAARRSRSYCALSSFSFSTALALFGFSFRDFS